MQIRAPPSPGFLPSHVASALILTQWKLTRSGPRDPTVSKALQQTFRYTTKDPSFHAAGGMPANAPASSSSSSSDSDSEDSSAPTLATDASAAQRLDVHAVREGGQAHARSATPSTPREGYGSSDVQSQMLGRTDDEKAAAGSKKRMDTDRADGGGTSGKRHKKEQAADGTSASSVKDSARVLDPAAPTKRRKGMNIRCEHNREGRNCKECGGSGICKHQRVRSKCKE